MDTIEKRKRLATWYERRMCGGCPLQEGFKCGRGAWFTTTFSCDPFKYTMDDDEIEAAYDKVFHESEQAECEQESNIAKTIKRGDIPHAAMELLTVDALQGMLRANPIFASLLPIIGIEIEKCIFKTERKVNGEAEKKS